MSDQWKVGKKKTKGLKKQTEKAVLTGLVTGRQSEEQVKEYLDELEFLAATAGAQTEKIFIQKLDNPNVRTYIG